MVFRIYDSKGDLIYEGRSWAYTRCYLDYLLWAHSGQSLRLEVVSGGVSCD